MSWMSGSAPTKLAEASKTTSEAPTEDPPYGHDEDRHMGEEEVAPSGWGDEDIML